MVLQIISFRFQTGLSWAYTGFQKGVRDSKSLDLK